VLGFIVCHFVSAMLSGRAPYCLSENWQTWAWIAIGWLVYRIGPANNDMRKILAVVALAGVLCAVYGLLTYVGMDILRPLYPFVFAEEGRNFVHSFFGNPEYFGGYAAPVAVLCFGRCLQSGARAVIRASWIMMTLLLVLALALSGTRGAFLGLFIGAALLVLRQLRSLTRAGLRRTVQVFAGAIAAAVAVAVIFSTPNPINQRDMRLIQRFAEAANLHSASIRERLLFFTLTSREIVEHPVFGAGPGTFRLDFFPNLAKFEDADPHAGVQAMALELQNRVAEHPHNDYLEYWYELGTVGIGFLFLLIALTLSRFFTQSWRSLPGSLETAELQMMNAGFFGAAICLVVNAAFSFPLHMAARGSLFWILLGCFFASDEMLREQGPDNDAKRPVLE
jgi:O-antigen ligase